MLAQASSSSTKKTDPVEVGEWSVAEPTPEAVDPTGVISVDATTDSVITVDGSGTLMYVDGSSWSTNDDDRTCSCATGNVSLIYKTGSYGNNVACFETLDDAREWLDDHSVSMVLGVFERKPSVVEKREITTMRQVKETKVEWRIAPEEVADAQ